MKNLPILSIVTWLPTVGAIVTLALFKKGQEASIKKFATAWFGIAFVVSLVLLYFLIGIWGGENRLYAAIKFFLYTLVGSVVMLLGVLKMYFLTQDTALTGQITQATIDLLAGNKQAAGMVSTTLQAAAQNGTGTFSIIYMQAM